MAKEINTFYDINKFPSSEGMLFFGISMSRIGNAQSPEKCFEYLKHLDTKYTHTEGIGLEVWYSDYLYFHSANPAHELRDRFKEQMIAHKNGFLNLLKKDKDWTLKAFSFKTFGQVFLDNSGIFPTAFSVIEKLYHDDLLFKEYVRKDSFEGEGRAVQFILEEITIFYLTQKGQLTITNPLVSNTKHAWSLHAYPGKPLRSEVYLFQKNPLNFSNSHNIYGNCYYDLEGKKLYDYSNLDIETFDFS